MCGLLCLFFVEIFMEKSVVLWLVIIGYLVLIVIVYFCNGEMDVCYEIKDL